ncbi:D-alanyl-D-alanine carboxypeptidase family protein [Saccharococcus caldoxylosilyticus]|uniref:D-alanyl-D-alanine carboxypeptidase family protein n=1 Tax=Saccharococcus caldoxylosilyticus TaxID=81408 RepID=UPI001C4E1BDD|nr:D-alanyl-D-alanine carboxypeptidase family protein [Parageobacillus caldoxylosilyticus]QXJ39730.1 D-alanyl-D-alanine carboxypeptidase DacF precursor [Parageobacillus caldoxylosilyticus]BDG36666.1 D-alanyl-D-alanine carboxypeptidase DacF [Parageobacillus caldoxylosilyticus]BDG40454.1 D-alanyl-D-alanine carboxypeptidase DacF [Parageobacillus caldoxylosilyticus]BDG44207.1 D-alanyl-D-alanine carboxypeptidase DacF [Parageobacillus caldoxylosilyticus]
MNKTLTRLLIFILVFLVPFSANVHAEEKKTEAKGLELADDAKSAILIERDTGAILYQKNAHEKLPPASMTKIMTMLLIMEAIDKGELSYKEKVRASEYAASMGGSQIFLEPGEEMTVDELLRGIAIGSANDASVAMAERIAGSEEAFVKMMNKKAKELGLKDTMFQNATGLPAEKHYSSAYDMAMLARELLKYEDITKYTRMYEDYLRENTDKKFWLVNTNRLVKFYPGVDGLKTGFTSQAKYCLTATAKKNGMRVIAVVFGASTPKSRNAQITKMLDYAFSQYKTHPVYKRNEVLTRVHINKGKKKTVALVTSEPISVLTKKGQSIDQIKKVIKVKDGVKAPIQKGDELGVLILKQDGKEILRSPIVAKESVAEASWWDLFKRTLQNFTKSA